MKKNKTKKKIKLGYKKYFSIFLSLISIVLILILFLMNLIPVKYFALLALIIVIISVTLIRFIINKKKFLMILGHIASIIYLIGSLIVINYGYNTISFFSAFGSENYITENYSIYVLDASNIKSIDELNNQNLYYINSESEGLKLIFNELEKLGNFNYLVKDMSDIKSSLDDNSAIMLEGSFSEVILESNNDYFDNLVKIYDKDVSYEIEIEDSDVNVLEDSYNIYISGIDTYGSINSAFRTDVNLILTVNPNSNSIHMTSIPRDYYVTMPKFDSKDKLTHTGVYGIETSVDSIENLLDIKLDFYIKVNFTTLIDVVDAIGGIEVNSNYSFTSSDNIYYKKGYNYLDGEEALSFARERNAFAGGDRIRVENQQLVLEAIINKAISPSILVNYNNLLNSLEGEFITNISNENIESLIKNQLSTNDSWNFTSYSLEGSDSSNYTYTTPNQLLYVMEPNLDSVNTAKIKIESTYVE